MIITKKRLRFILKHKRIFSIMCLLILLFPIYFIYTEYRHIEEKTINEEVNKVTERIGHYYKDSIEELSALKMYATSFSSINEVNDYFNAPSNSNLQAMLEQEWIKQVLSLNLLNKVDFFDLDGVLLASVKLRGKKPPEIVAMQKVDDLPRAKIKRLISLSNKTVVEVCPNNGKFGLVLFHKLDNQEKRLGYFSLHIDVPALTQEIEFHTQYTFPLLLVNDRGNILLDHRWDGEASSGKNYFETLNNIDPKLWEIIAYHPWSNYFKRGELYYVFRYFKYPLTEQEHEIAVVTRVSEDVMQATMREYLDPLIIQGALLFILALVLTFPFYYIWRTAETFILEEELKKLPMQGSTPIVITNEKHELILANAALLKLFGTTLEKVKGRDPYKLEHPSPVKEEQIKELRHGIVEHGEWSGMLAMRKENGDIIEELVNVRRVNVPGGNAQYFIGTFYDIHQHTDRVKDLKDQVEKDSVTGCYSRGYFYKKLQREVAFIKQHQPEYRSCVALIHVENFVSYSRHFGYLEGDMLLTHIGKLLTSFSSKTEIISRFRGEIFSIILPFTNIDRAMGKIREFEEYVKDNSLDFSYNAHMKKERIALAFVLAEIPAYESTEQLLKSLDTRYREDLDIVRIPLGE